MSFTDMLHWRIPMKCEHDVIDLQTHTGEISLSFASKYVNTLQIDRKGASNV